MLRNTLRSDPHDEDKTRTFVAGFDAQPTFSVDDKGNISPASVTLVWAEGAVCSVANAANQNYTGKIYIMEGATTVYTMTAGESWPISKPAKDALELYTVSTKTANRSNGTLNVGNPS